MLTLSVILGLLVLFAAIGSVTVTYKAQATVNETLATNTDSAAASKRVVTHDLFDIAGSYNAGTVPPMTTLAEFIATLVGGALTIDLRNLSGTNGAVIDGNGLKPQIIRIKNLGANSMTFKKGAVNGHNAFTATDGFVIPPGAHVQFFTNDNTDDIDATHKTWDVTGTGAQTAQVTIIMG